MKGQQLAGFEPPSCGSWGLCSTAEPTASSLKRTKLFISGSACFWSLPTSEVNWLNYEQREQQPWLSFEFLLLLVFDTFDVSFNPTFHRSDAGCGSFGSFANWDYEMVANNMSGCQVQKWLVIQVGGEKSRWTVSYDVLLTWSCSLVDIN